MIRITANTLDFQRQLDGVARQQLPFALANTLTSTAWDAVRKKTEDLPRIFHIRNSRTAKGFRVKKALKRNLVATITHKDAFMKLQEDGGEKRSADGGRVGSPGPFPAEGDHKAGGARKTVSQTTPRSKWPGNINRKFFIHKGGMVLEYARTGRRKDVRKRKRHKNRHGGRLVRDINLEKRGLDPNLKLMYVLRTSVPVKPRLKMAETVLQTIKERFGINFDRELANAIKTARPK